jgi:NADPH:quinone reductase-like Zn-dependent oxidoreductase
VVTIADYPGAQETGVSFSAGMGMTRAARAVRDIINLIETGQFSIPVARTFPLEEIAEAHRLSETGHVRGKLILVPA